MTRSLIYIFFALLFTACSTEDEQEVSLHVNESEIIFLSTEDIKHFNIESNSSWEIHEIPSWIELNTSEGTGNKQVSIKAIANPKEEERSTTLRIIAGDKQQYINIKQLAKNVTLALSKAILEFPAERMEEGLTFDIISNEKWTIEEVPDWCEIDKKDGEGNATIKIITDKNYVDSERTVILEVKAGSKTEQIKIKQDALNIILAFSNDELSSWGEVAQLNPNNTSMTASIMIRSNTKWFIQNKSSSWYTIDKSEGINNEKIIISVLDNNDKNSRKDEIIIKAGSKSIKLFIIQTGFTAPIDNPYQISIENNAPRIGDHLVKKLVEYTHPGNPGKNLHWDFSSLISINDHYEVSYSAPPLTLEGKYIMGWDEFNINEVSDNSLIVCKENYTMHYLRIRNNTLESLGYENPVNIAKYDPRMYSVIYSSEYNIPVKHDYQAKRLYSGTEWMEWNGYTDFKIDGYGTITLPCGTYSDVIRTKRIQTIVYDGYVNDVLTTIKQTYTIYSWYVKGYRYPVFETHNSVFDPESLSSTPYAIYYSPKDHTYLNNTKQLIQLNEKERIPKNISSFKGYLEHFSPRINR